MLPSMPTGTSRSNRGPAVASRNRQALLDAARRQFAERGYDVPLRIIAQEAGVGQGVLYRHFPRRIDLALAVFEANMANLERKHADVGAGSLLRLWEGLVHEVEAAAAFVDLLVHSRDEDAARPFADRLRALLRRHLEPAVAAGEVRPDLTVGDVQLAIRMVYGLVATAESGTPLAPAVERLTEAWFR